MTVAEDLLARGIEIISATEPHMDSTTPTGRLLRNIFASVAEHEREMIRERVVAGLRKTELTKGEADGEQVVTGASQLPWYRSRLGSR